MKSILVVLLLVSDAIFTYSQDMLTPIDEVTAANNSQSYVSSVNITGNLNELVIPVGFPDKANTISFPILENKPLYPLVGQFPDGTLLSDYIAQNGGSIPEDLWYEPALNNYFTTVSGGLYNVNFQFIKKTNNTRYLTTRDFSDFADLNSLIVGLDKNKDSAVVINLLGQILNEIAQNMYTDNPNVFNDIDLLHFTFQGITKKEFWNGSYGGTVKYNMTLRLPNGQLLYNKPISIQINTGAVLHEYMHIIGAVAGYPPTGNVSTGFNGFPDRGSDKQRSGGHYNMIWDRDIMYHNSSLRGLHSLYGEAPILSHDLIFLGWIRPEEILIVNQSIQLILIILN